MKIEIELVPPGGVDRRKGEKTLHSRFEYDEVGVRDGAGRERRESAQDFLRRPYLERYKLIREGRAVLMHQGKALELSVLLGEVRAPVASAAGGGGSGGSSADREPRLASGRSSGF